MTAPLAQRQTETGLTPADTRVIGWGPERAGMHALERCIGKRKLGRNVRLILLWGWWFVKQKVMATHLLAIWHGNQRESVSQLPRVGPSLAPDRVSGFSPQTTPGYG